MNPKGVVILGATGSIGKSAARVLEALPGHFRVIGLVARNNTGELARQAALFRPRLTVTTAPERLDELKSALPSGLAAAAGDAPVLDLVTAPETDTVLCAIVGTGGLEPVIAALRAGKRVALASKEVMVMAGELIRRELAASPGGEIVPVDSEHSAIFQCLAGHPAREVKNLWLTASGGPFREWSAERIAAATLRDALAHPTWDMGPKVTIDSASLMNKALELIEARHLFNVPPERLKVVIHPQSLVHSMVELCDGSFIAQMSKPDMRFAIQYALTWPERAAEGGLPELDFARLVSLDFREPDRSRFPSLDFAYHAMHIGGTMTAAMNAANEVAVDKFRRGEIGFAAIWTIIEKTMSAHHTEPQSDLAAIRDADRRAREFASQLY
ncbi:1-deoxy-D-xylulose-5-phosphate reductoisomerase [Victivallis vadensis]|uniref:1-deoxy-D-xylulose 5-phosphate reductoisomerase n=1 Tax=Victivallis vadensis TaxID=172901 RepID=A0A848AUK3_9BACT|nr:1-deoxy-D-xylulose-5-phosphate reductoisomerase [Victivallis vadensis]NMD85280.1 1-deoxy-D-xylulose-5-phosphate reductoisomerase [Victivallis vadensis]